MNCAPAESPPTPCFHHGTTVETLPAQLIGSFSWRRNLQWLCSADVDDDTIGTIADDVRFIGGLKVLCCLSILLVHVCVFVVQISSE